MVVGRVQGVGYRRHAQREAQALGLRGWVRNRADGRVELMVEGPAAPVERFLARCAEGPPRAAVARVEAVDQDGGEPLRDFAIAPTI